MWKCKHCNKKFEYESVSQKANHSRWCDKNPNRGNNSHLSIRGIINKFGEKKTFEVTCETCNKRFDVIEREKIFPSKEKYFCNRQCANSVGGRAKATKYNHMGHYRDIAFKIHGKYCFICGFDKVVEVHHIDKNRDNNTKENLVPLCPNHHMMIHRSKFRDEVTNQIKSKLGGEM